MIYKIGSNLFFVSIICFFIFPQSLSASEVTTSYDFRFRYEYTDDSSKSSKRRRNRIRSRLGIQYSDNERLKIKIRLATAVSFSLMETTILRELLLAIKRLVFLEISDSLSLTKEALRL